MRLAFVSWGAERLLAAERVLALCPGHALGHWFAATVFVARAAFDKALEHLRDGCAAQDAQQKDVGRFAALGLHLLHGLVLAARPSDGFGSQIDEAREELQRELALENPHHVYARECAANTWYAIGALNLRQERFEGACSAFREALARVPNHALATIGLQAATRTTNACALADPCALFPDPFALAGSSGVDRATVHAIVLALRGEHGEAASVCRDALLHASPGSEGYLLPVDPLLHVTAHREA